MFSENTKNVRYRIKGIFFFLCILFLFAALLCFLVGLVGLLTTSWRLYVLKRRQFLPFRCWLVSFFRQ